MLHLENHNNKDLIFAIQSKMVSRSYSSMVGRKSKQTKCGIFNIDNNDWIDIKPFKYFKGPNNTAFSCKLCCNYDNDIIYLWDCSDIFDNQCGCTSLYDMNKHEWKSLSTDKSLSNKLSPFWYDNQILHGLSKAIRDLQYELNKLDLRDNKRKWMRNRIDFEFDGMDKDRLYSFFT